MSGSRRNSTSSLSSGSSSPRLTTFDSSTALILVPDDQDSESAPFDFTDDDDDETEQQYTPQKTSTPLYPTTVFLYLLSPYLKLGALLLPNLNLPLKYGIPSLVCLALLSAFARQIWYMLARYLRKSDLEDIILDAFARGRGKERRREILRTMVRSGTGGLRILLATVYLRRECYLHNHAFSDTGGQNLSYWSSLSFPKHFYYQPGYS
jgi:hypothetical protein